MRKNRKVWEYKCTCGRILMGTSKADKLPFGKTMDCDFCGKKMKGSIKVMLVEVPDNINRGETKKEDSADIYINIDLL